MTRTSISHPLDIASVSAGPGLGRVGLTFCPGKHDPDGMGGGWDRDLACDIDAIRAWGAAAVVTLIAAEEMTLLRVERLGAAVVAGGMAWFHLPIIDMSVPGADFERRWESAGGAIRVLLRSGRDVLVHCRGGRGRAGTIGARLLIELGMGPAVAIDAVRAVRPGAIETSGQEGYVLRIGAGS